MTFWLISLIAIVSTLAFLFLWFRDVRRIMRERASTVESARKQLVACRESARKARRDPAYAAVIERSENIYRQAVTIYNKALKKPWNYLPAHLMGFRDIS